MRIDCNLKNIKEAVIVCIEGYLATYERLENKEGKTK